MTYAFVMILFFKTPFVVDTIKYNKCNVVQQYFIREQVLDIDEAHNFCQFDKGFLADLQVMFNRQIELTGVPRIEAVMVFGIDKASCNELLMFNHRHEKYLRNMRKLYPSQEKLYSRIIKDNKRRYDIYNRIYDCYRLEYLIMDRRFSLRDLRNLIGEENFYAGRLPDHVPFQYFTEVR